MKLINQYKTLVEYLVNSEKNAYLAQNKRMKHGRHVSSTNSPVGRKTSKHNLCEIGQITRSLLRYTLAQRATNAVIRQCSQK